ncbi:hypothetical protein AVEN_181977-1 [Araneus ventricosus]|uniref:Uncharacterized protein n=1 Tax=Araneus ventricosus TaxID=182803 RepID=A0A4Y2JRY5_ARAVE|nr:hypothetical protein AVEN_181977-1 [Araneus ventricosus]
MRRRRITRLQFERLPNATSLSSASEEGLPAMTRRVVREEIQRLLPQVVTCNEESLESIVREKIKNSLVPLSLMNGTGDRNEQPRA